MMRRLGRGAFFAKVALMKTLFRTLALSIALLMSLGLVACADTAVDETDATETYTFTGIEYEVAALEGTVHVPDGYGAPQPAGENKALIAASDGSDVEIAITVNDKIYDDVNYTDIKKGEAELYALNAALGFGAADFDIVEGNGQRFFTFTSKEGADNVFHYATIIDGHMVYVSMDTGEEPITEEQQADLESIAMSIQSAL